MQSKPIRVLLVDDDEEDFVFTRDSLLDVAPGAFHLDWVSTYDAALEASACRAHDAYLLDYRLGPSNGLELLRAMIAQGVTAPLILLTGQGDREIDMEAMKAGAADYVPKGWSAALLERAIRYAIERKHTEEALRRMRDELEVRVQERTAELAKANQILQAEIQERKWAGEQLRASLNEKEILLREIHHRVKNNLQVVSSLMKLQSRHIADPQALAMFKETQSRVKSMAIIHEKLYRTGDLARIDFAAYMRSLTDYLFHAYAVNSGNVAVAMNVEEVSLPIDAVMPCALLLHELVSNSLKHAFPGGKGKIFIEFHKIGGGKFVLQAGDNGIGFGGEPDLHHPTTLGLQLINALVEQLDASIEFENKQGVCFRITFPTPKYRDRDKLPEQCISVRRA
jgi:two-component sensor histidine kinase/CheY-like chemotaxis protein